MIIMEQTFGEKLRGLRVARGLSQKAVAEHLGISMMAYAHYELNDREPSLDTLRRLCDFFDVSADYLIGRAEF